MPTRQELQLLQALPLELKIMKTKQRVREWVQRFGVDGVYVSFSGGKDSTVLLHIVRELYPEVEAVFVDTGLEYPEIRKFVKGFENVTWLRPKMRFDEVIKKYGYPVIGKEVAERIDNTRKCLASGGEKYVEHYYQINGTLPNERAKQIYGDRVSKRFDFTLYKPLVDVNFRISSHCCNVMKKQPVKKYQKQVKKYPITGQMAEESRLRLKTWLKNGCNGFNMKSPISNPLSFWRNQDIFQYIHDNNLEIASVYGDVEDSNYLSGQMCIEGCETWKTTGAERTGCIFCLFGMHLEKGETRLQRLHRTHPKLYDYCMNGGEFVDGNWQPNKKGLGMKFVCDEVNRVMGKELLRY